MKASTIKEVLSIIDDLIHRFEVDENPLGYFAAVYKMTTQKVHEAVQNKAFENNERMERMDVIFANRYFKALTNYFDNQPASQPWQVAFDTAHQPNIIVDQHFFLSANAHINYDLGIAAATTCPGEEIYAFEGDFNKMNGILSSLYNTVNYDIAKIFPPLYKWLRWADQPIKFFENLYMIDERNKAWSMAVEIATAQPSDKKAIEKELEIRIAAAGQKIANPCFLLKPIFKWISHRELGSVADRIKCFKS